MNKPKQPARVQNTKVVQIAALLGISFDSLNRWGETGEINTYQDGDTVRHFTGKKCQFCMLEVESMIADLPLSSLQVAKRLGITVSSARRLETAGLLASESRSLRS